MKCVLLVILTQIIFSGIAGGSEIKDPASIRDIKFLSNSGEIRVAVNVDGPLKTLPEIEISGENLLQLDIDGSYTEPAGRSFSMDDPDLEKVDLYQIDGNKVRMRLFLPEPYERGAGRVWKTKDGFIIALERKERIPVSAFPESPIQVEENDTMVEQAFPTIFKSEKKDYSTEEKTFLTKEGDSTSNPVIRMISSLAIVIGVFLIGAFFIRKKFLGRGTAGNGDLIKVLDRNYIDVKKGIAIVDVAGEILVIGIYEGGITMLTKLEGEDAVARVMAKHNRGTAKFADIVKKASVDLKISDDQNDIAPGATVATAGMPPNTLMNKIRKLRPIK